MGHLERRITELEQYTESAIRRAPKWNITPAEALLIFDILAEAGAVENVMLASPDYQPDIVAAIV